MDSEPTVIYTTPSAENAFLLKNVLAENGIDAHVANMGTATASGMGISLAWPQVAVAAKDAVEARRIAVEFDQHQAIDTAENVEPATSTAAPGDWPVCPRCGTRRTAVCPACRTAGTDFPAADKMPEAEPGQPERQLLICPECDEPFTPGYLRRCVQCDYPFEDPGDVEAVEDLETGALRANFSGWVWVVAVISVVLVVAAIAILFLSSEPRKPAWTPPDSSHRATNR
jgi:hypothetical protein